MKKVIKVTKVIEVLGLQVKTPPQKQNFPVHRKLADRKLR